jgi:hypothetical protein
MAERLKRYYIDPTGILWYTYLGGSRWMLAKNPCIWISSWRIEKRRQYGWKLTPIYPSPEQLKALLVLSN